MKGEISQDDFKDLLVHLVGAVSAYAEFSGNVTKPGKRDALYSTRLTDFNKAIERGRKLYRKTFAIGTKKQQG